MIAGSIELVAGVALVLFTARQIFQDIFHPTHSGSISDYVGKFVKFALKRTSLRPSIGPFALVLTILSWVLLMAIGFALIYLPLYPRFFAADGLTFSLPQRLLRSFYLSIGSLATFQTFDIKPQADWLKLLIGIEGMVGISMITASVSWLVLIYPALERVRFLAKQTTVVLKARERAGLQELRGSDAPLLRSFADRVIQVRLDLILFPILLNFHAQDSSATLAVTLPDLLQLARAGDLPQCATELQITAHYLQVALDELAKTLSERVLSSEYTSTDASFHAFKESVQ